MSIYKHLLLIKKPNNKLALAAAIGAVLFLSGVTTANAAELKLAHQQPTVINDIAGDTDGTYIVRLTDAPIATYDGGIPGYKATSAKANGDQRLNTKSKAAKSYEKYLKDQQKTLLGNAGKAFGRDLDIKFDYQHAINGFAVELTAAEAKALRSMSGVASVQRERMETPLTDAGPAWIGAPSIWDAGGGTKGEGLVVAVLDTGINSDHPSFADIGGDGYDHTNPLGSGVHLDGDYCDTVDATFCNDKLIGAWSFVSEAVTPEDSDGHGSHTASTAAGNVVVGAELVAPTTSAVFDISGVAPHANVIAYDVCIDGCPGSALVAAINQVLIDAGNLPNGIASLNYSISGGGNPYNDTVELGFLSAVAAGIYVSASAGNAGPGPSTVAHLGPWVSTTAASTHNRAIVNNLIDLSSDGDGTPDISGLGFTAGYGPAPIINSADLEGLYPGATLCGVGDDDGDTSPFPPGTFSGEIVACTRGTYGRVEKGANVLAAGAGGYILMDNGAGLVGDAHVLPGVHISAADSATLTAWLAANSGNNPMGTIEGYAFDYDVSNGDVMGGFSSRGPQTAFDVLKPDVTAPGVDIMGAEANGQGLGTPEYQIISGTSMSSPHNAGAGALMTGYRPGWSPQAIKSAIMMTASTVDMVKEDGATPADPFDHGAGRVDLTKAGDAGLVLNESIGNFWAANPDLGGDPSELNVASMMSSNCVGKCEWRRTVTGVNSGNNKFNLSTSGPEDVVLTTNPDKQIVVGKNKSKEVIVRADTTFAPRGWNFAELQIDPVGSGPDLHMPIAVFAADSTDSNIFNKTVDITSDVEPDDVLTYEITITNGQLAGNIELSDMIPAGTTFVPGSETEVVVNGTTTTPFALSGNTLTWNGELDTSGLQLSVDGAPFGFFSLPGFGVAPFGIPSGCDDGGWIINVPSFSYNGSSYTSVIMSVNGTLEAGTASGLASDWVNRPLPDGTAPNNVMAPLWRDLRACETGQMYVANLSAGPYNWTIYEWTEIPDWGTGNLNTFQIWVERDGAPFWNGSSPEIHFTYGRLDDVGFPATVGVEDASGSTGDSYYFNGSGSAPEVGTDLLISSIPGGSATLGFQVTVDECNDPGIANQAQISNHGDKERAIATSTCAAP